MQSRTLVRVPPMSLRSKFVLHFYKDQRFFGEPVILSSLLAAGRAALSRPDAVCRRRSSQRTPHFGFNTPLDPCSLQLTFPTYHPPAHLVNASTPNALNRSRTVIFRPRAAPPHLPSLRPRFFGQPRLRPASAPHPTASESPRWLCDLRPARSAP